MYPRQRRGSESNTWLVEPSLSIVLAEIHIRADSGRLANLPRKRVELTASDTNIVNNLMPGYIITHAFVCIRYVWGIAHTHVDKNFYVK